MPASKIEILAYKNCETCKKALKWLEQNGVDASVRPIVEEPPTLAELKKWIPASGLPIGKWLNTSGQSYRALGKEKIDSASEEQLREWLAADGKLVKRPVLVRGETVLVGFKPDQYSSLFGKS